mmetsp:Transcript_27994/g.63604  ORF Transcript_27994/g.63604 Transcript_27994/m.63604 type:complete len:205 (+) Transcript_27994:95-709(+)
MRLTSAMPSMCLHRLGLKRIPASPEAWRTASSAPFPCGNSVASAGKLHLLNIVPSEATVRERSSRVRSSGTLHALLMAADQGFRRRTTASATMLAFGTATAAGTSRCSAKPRHRRCRRGLCRLSQLSQLCQKRWSRCTVTTRIPTATPQPKEMHSATRTSCGPYTTASGSSLQSMKALRQAPRSSSSSIGSSSRDSAVAKYPVE